MNDLINNSKSNRIEWLDVAKGIGIILVVFSHLSANEDPNEWLFKLIFSFHMPLFFFISGMLFSCNYNFIEFVKRKFRTIFVPYLLFLFICLIQEIVGQYPNIILKDFIITYGAKLFGYGIGMYYYYNGPIWFLGALFFSEIIFYFATKPNKTWIIIATILGGIAGVIFIKTELPFGIRYYFEISIFLGTGYLLKKPLLDIVKKLKKKHLVIIFHVSAIVLLLFSNMNTKVIMRANSLGNLFVFFLCAILGVISVISLSVLLKSDKVLQFYGANSIIVLCLHLYFNRLFFPYIFSLIGINDVFKDT